MTTHDIGRGAGRKRRSAPRSANLLPSGAGMAAFMAGYSEERLGIRRGPAAAMATVVLGAVGVVLARRPEAGHDMFQVIVAMRDGRTPVPVGPIMDDLEIIAHWRGVAEDLGLPLLVERMEGGLFAPYEQIGRLRLGPFRYRRRNATLSRRRPRFLQRRKGSRMPERPTVLSEREFSPRF